MHLPMFGHHEMFEKTHFAIDYSFIRRFFPLLMLWVSASSKQDEFDVTGCSHKYRIGVTFGITAHYMSRLC